jgi:hypothetical protein
VSYKHFILFIVCFNYVIQTYNHNGLLFFHVRHDVRNHGCPTFYGKGPHPLLWGGCGPHVAK